MKPLHDVVLLRKVSSDSKIIMTESQSEVAKGIIEAVGPGQAVCGNEREYIVPIRVQPGQVVYYIRNHALKVKDLWAVKEKDIICVEENGNIGNYIVY